MTAYLGADATGRLTDVPRLLGDLRAAPAPTTDAEAANLPTALATALATGHHLLLSGNGDAGSVHRLLMDAVETALHRPDIPDGVLLECFYSLAWTSFFGGSGDLWEPLARAVAHSGRVVPESLSLLMTCLADPAGTALPAGRPVLRRLDDAVGRLDTVTDPVEVVRIGTAAMYVGRVEGCVPALRRLVDAGPPALAIHAMNVLSGHRYETGEWDGAGRLAADGLELSDRLGYRLLAQLFRHRQGMLAATRGDNDRAEELAVRASPRSRGDWRW
ncbi:hypothetical protein Vau01_110500 [Virgisporangium aurantiacum]|uniref:Uncharacterized protein n=2 Tax=Virgisporangium aurantiacum TaxID=175570 RepID=A0A8J4E6S7_9ACTN|nr:hypothetical protein Vau01_110500 [Virgisporangium aurantiacum]